MIFNFGKKKNQNSREEPSGSVDIKSINDNLYRQNAEIASKNKSLSILRKLYEISILTQSPATLARRICESIQDEMAFELVGIFTYDQEENNFKPLSFISSDRLSNFQAKAGIDFNKIILSPGKSKTVGSVVSTKVSMNSNNISDIWSEKINKNIAKELHEDGHIKTTIMSPLIIENKITGLSIFSMNRDYESLSDHEIESIGNFKNIITVAVDRAMIHQRLTISNQDLESANQRLKELDHQKSEFISFATHQLRTPLSSIKGYSSMILEGDYGDVDDKVREVISRNLKSSNDLVKMIDDYLNVSRIELGRMEYDTTEFFANELVEEVVVETKLGVEEKGLILKLDLSGEKMLIKGDREKIKQVYMNIIDNARKYTDKGSITVALKKEKDQAVYSVTDTGMGMEKDEIDKLFNKFVRTAGAKNTKIIGTGLGLFLVKKILEVHKGTFSADSPGKDKGSTFVIKLPLIGA